jgi:hypothetical protein
MHFWFWFFSLLAALAAWRQECVSTLQAVCKGRKNMKSSTLTVERWQVGSLLFGWAILDSGKTVQIHLHTLKLITFSFYE